jgi:hypothetical protein
VLGCLGLLASGGDAYVVTLLGKSRKQRGWDRNASFFDVWFITTIIHVLLLSNYGEIRSVRVSVYKGDVLGVKLGLERIPYTHTLTELLRGIPTRLSHYIDIGKLLLQIRKRYIGEVNSHTI